MKEYVRMEPEMWCPWYGAMCGARGVVPKMWYPKCGARGVVPACGVMCGARGVVPKVFRLSWRCVSYVFVTSGLCRIDCDKVLCKR